MANLKDKTLLYICSGGFFETALSLANYYKEVLYYVQWTSGFPGMDKYVVGSEYKNGKVLDTFDGKPLRRVYDIYSHLEEVDIIMYSDVYDGEQAEFFRSLGYPVVSAGKGAELELDRWKCKVEFKGAGMDVNPAKRVVGIDALREELMKVKDRYIKISRFRKQTETFHHDEYILTEPLLNKMEHEMGPMSKIIEFIIEEPIDAIVEEGVDMYTVDGKYPQMLLAGVEIKDCYDQDTEILTDNGWKLFKDLDKTEKVYTLDISDKRHIRSSFQQPIDYIEKEYNGKLVSIEKDSVSLRITPNHKVLIQDTYQNPDAEEVNWTSTNTFSCSAVFKRGKTDLKLEKIQNLVDVNKRFSMLQPKHLYISPNPSLTKIHIGKWKLNKGDFAEFMGLYLSEGCARIRINNAEVNIAQFKYPDAFENTLKKLPFKYHKIGVGFNIYDMDLAKYLIPFGKSYQKFVPKWIKECSKKIINRFLTAYCLGDGSFVTKYKSVRKDSTIAYKYPTGYKEMTSRLFYTSSPKMADDLQELLLRVGSVSTLSTAKVYYNKTDNIDYAMYTVVEKLINRKNYIFPKDISYENYKGKIYCVTVPSGIIMIRRNGKAMWCGNSGYAGMIMPYDKLSEGVKETNAQLVPILKKYKYDGFLSTEVRTTKDSHHYLIDMTCRLPQPPSALYGEMFDNLGDIVWALGQREVVGVKPKATYGLYCTITSDWYDEAHQAIHFPEKYRHNVKLHYPLKVDGQYYCLNLNNHPECGSVVTVGSSFEDCKKQMEEIAKEVKGYGVSVKTDSIDTAIEEFAKMMKGNGTK